MAANQDGRWRAADGSQAEDPVSSGQCRVVQGYRREEALRHAGDVEEHEGEVGKLQAEGH